MTKKEKMKMLDNLFADYDLDNELDNTIILNDEKGNPVAFEFLDLVKYKENEYVVLYYKKIQEELLFF